MSKKKKCGRGLTSIKESVNALIQKLENYIKKARKKADYSDQKQYRQHKHQHNKNNKKKKMGRKTTVWIFQATNKWNLTREKNLDKSKKWDPKRETESLRIAVQNNAIRIHYVKPRIDWTQ